MGAVGHAVGRAVNRTVNRLEVAQLRRTGRSVLSTLYRTRALVLETVGRRSGQARATPLAHHTAADGSLMIVGGAAGMVRTPTGSRTSAANPGRPL